MTLWTLIRRSLCFHARAHLGVVLGAAVGSAALIGALIVGDSVRESLRGQALQRLGHHAFALAPSDRFFTQPLAEKMQLNAALLLPATMARQDVSARANQVNVLGVQSNFWNLPAPVTLPRGSVLLNEALAAQLAARPGDEVLLRIHKPSALSRDVPITPQSDASVALRLKVHGVLPASELGNFSLRSGQTPPMNAFVNLAELQSSAGLEGRANLLLAGSFTNTPRKVAFPVRVFFKTVLREHVSPGLAAKIELYRTAELPAAQALSGLGHSLQQSWRLTDAEFDFHPLPASDTFELTSQRIFIEPAVDNHISEKDSDLIKGARLKRSLGPPPTTVPLLTYLANRLSVGTNGAPYSMVTAAGAPYTPKDLRDDEVIINQWLADDLRAKPGDELALTYFLPDSASQLAEATNRFRIRAIAPMTLPHADRTLMPNFPGLSKAESTHDWDAGFPLVHKIRDQDEKYWKDHRGTPKAFVTLRAGQTMWGNRFGNLTAIRFPVPAGASTSVFATNMEAAISQYLQPATLGYRFEPVREQALAAATQGQDFGGLFIGFSFFLIGAALILMGLLFQFGIEQRAAEIGTLLALGWEPRRVRRLFLLEGMALALVGGALGAVGGIFYARALLHGLTTVWRDAVGTAALTYHATTPTLLIGFASAVIVSALTIWLVLRKLGRRPARELLTGEAQSPRVKARSRGRLVALAAGAATTGLVGWAVWAKETANPEIFFSAGALCLIATLGAAAWWLGRLQGLGSGAGGTPAPLTLRSLGLRGTARRRTRSLATIALLACGSFLIASIGINRLDANLHAEQRSSGTGGFALIGESTLPIMKDLNTREGREALGLDDKILQGVSFVPFRVRNGDDASCLNLNRAQTPRMLGVKSEPLHKRFTFAMKPNLAATGVTNKGDYWAALDWNGFAVSGSVVSPSIIDPTVHAIGDAASIQWALHKKIGDSLEFTDERGQKFNTLLVGGLANSILQGSLIVDEAEFLKKFPGESGYRMFLIDCPSNALPKVSAELSRALQDFGFEVTPAARRLAQFNAVQNTYLNTFQLLGGLGLLLGSAGLGVVVLRNVLERRGELALLLAVGFERGALQRLVLAEHAALLVLGLGAGLVSAVVSVLPTVLSPTAVFPLGSLALTLGAVFVTGLLATWLATRWALRGNLLEGLRNE